MSAAVKQSRKDWIPVMDFAIQVTYVLPRPHFVEQKAALAIWMGLTIG
jgi:hypothetical protein